MTRLAALLFLAIPAFAGTTLLSVPPAVPSHGEIGRLLGGDFNGDGLRDFLVMDHDGMLALHHGLGDGTFAPAVLTHAHWSRYHASVAAADFDRDGQLDLAIHEYSAYYGQILLFSGRADGTFARSGVLPAAADGSTPQLGDFTGDGHLDLAVPNVWYQGPSIRVHPGDGNGGFGVPIVTPVVFTWQDVEATATGDFDGDGNLDLLIASGTKTYLSYGTGHGRFGRSATLDGGARSLAVADYNSDGRPDWIAGTTYGQRRLRAWINQPDGTFAMRELDGGTSPARVVAADMNADGVPDLVAYAAGSHVAVFASRNDGTFAPPRLFTPGREVWAIDAGRFDGDAIPDVLAAGPRLASVTRGRGDGTLDAPESYATGIASTTSLLAMQLADVTGDGAPDAVAVGLGIQGHLVIHALPNDGHGRLGAPIATGTSLRTPHSWDRFPILVADFTGDDRPDVAMAMATGLHLLAGRGDGTFDAPVVTPGDHRRGLHAADFNGDGRPDLMAIADNRHPVVYLNGGSGTFGEGIRTEGPYSNDGLVVADFDGDGNLDLARGTSLIFLGTGDGRFVLKGDDWSSGFEVYAGGDFDEDGLVDLIARRGHDVLFLHGKGDGTLEDASTIRFDRPLHAAADVDGDGHLDLIGAGHHVTILLGDGHGSFHGAASVAYGGLAEAMALADLDGNGSLDVAVGEGWSNTIDVFLTRIAPPLGQPATLTVDVPETVTHGHPFTARVEIGSASRHLHESAVILREHDRDRVVAIRHPGSDGKTAFDLLLSTGVSDFTATLADDRLFTAPPAGRRIHVDKGRVWLSITVDDPPFAGKPVAFWYSYSVEGGGYLAGPTGPLTLTVDGLRQETFDIRSRGRFSIHLKRYGAITITAEYAGDANYHPARLTRTVVLSPPLGDVALLVEPGRHVTAGTPVTFRAVVTPATAGSVMFFDRDRFLGSAPVRNGAARLTTDTLPRGTHLVHAVFSGDEHSHAARSTGVYVTVEGPPLPKRRRTVR